MRDKTFPTTFTKDNQIHNDSTNIYGEESGRGGGWYYLHIDLRKIVPMPRKNFTVHYIPYVDLPIDVLIHGVNFVV